MRKRKGNFGIFSNFDHFVPGIPDLVILCIWLLLGVFIANVVALVPTLLFQGSAMSGMDAVMLVSYPLMFIPAMIYASVRSRNNESFEKGYRLNNSHFAPVGGALCAVLAIVATLSLNFLADFFISLLPPMPENLKAALEGITQGNFVMNLICVAVFAPLFEEWLCRGMVLRGLLKHKNKKGKSIRPVWAIVISAAFFAIIHANPWQAIAAFMLGCLFGYLYWKTGSLYLTMLLHAVNNFTALILSNVPALENMESWSELLDRQTFVIVLCACALLVVLCIRQFRKIQFTEETGSFDEVPALFD